MGEIDHDVEIVVHHGSGCRDLHHGFLALGTAFERVTEPEHPRGDRGSGRGAPEPVDRSFGDRFGPVAGWRGVRLGALTGLTGLAALGFVHASSLRRESCAVDSDGVWISEYERAVDTMLAGDLDGLRALLDDGPDLTVQVSHWPHRATLLHDAGVTAGVAAVLRAAGAR